LRQWRHGQKVPTYSALVDAIYGAAGLEEGATEGLRETRGTKQENDKAGGRHAREQSQRDLDRYALRRFVRFILHEVSPPIKVKPRSEQEEAKVAVSLPLELLLLWCFCSCEVSPHSLLEEMAKTRFVNAKVCQWPATGSLGFEVLANLEPVHNWSHHPTKHTSSFLEPGAPCTNTTVMILYLVVLRASQPWLLRAHSLALSVLVRALSVQLFLDT
jgi:hypothetical protein